MKLKAEYEFEFPDAEFNTALENALKNLPDFVLVTRCKDCKWFNTIGCAIEIAGDLDNPAENDFCSFGERKESADNG